MNYLRSSHALRALHRIGVSSAGQSKKKSKNKEPQLINAKVQIITHGQLPLNANITPYLASLITQWTVANVMYFEALKEP